jgi:hypothetical protein
MQIVTDIIGMLSRCGQKLGPYLMLEILLPGGTLFALLLILYRRRSTLLSPALAAARQPVCVSDAKAPKSDLRKYRGSPKCCQSYSAGEIE